MHRPPPTFEVNGTAIRTIRMHLGLDLAECSRQAGISKSFLTQLELGLKRHMRPPTYTALRTVLKATDRQLLAPHEDSPERK